MLRGRKVYQPVWTFVRNRCTVKSLDLQAVKLTNRSVIRLSGNESRDFIQGLITNDINHLGGQSSSIYSLFLNKQGRVLHDVIIYGSEDKSELFVETDNSVAQDLRKHMMIYRIRRKISIDVVDDEYKVWAAFGGDQEKKIDLPEASYDPRVKGLGQRLLTRLSDDEMAARVTIGSVSNFRQHRYRLGVAEGVKEIMPGKAFPLEVNCDYMHGLSVHKGCYLGQEFTARTYHTGVVRKRIMPLELESSMDDADLIDKDVQTQDGKAGGKVRALEDRVGIGLLRVETVLAAERLLANKSTPVRTWKPNWWPIVAPKSSVD